MIGVLICLANPAAAAPSSASGERTYPAKNLGVISDHHAKCLMALTSLPAEAVAISDDFTPVDCPGSRMTRVFRTDRLHHCTRLVRTVMTSEIVPVFPEFGTRMIEPGDALHLVTAEGAVRVVRTVEAMQPAKPGQRLFVKTPAGEILSVRYESGSQ